MNKNELIALVVVIVILAILLLLPSDKKDNKSESFATDQRMELETNAEVDKVSGNDQQSMYEKEYNPVPNTKNFESLIYDNVTGTIMTGTQFMENTGIVAPPWVAPAWDPDAYGPSSKGELDPSDYENDPRMLYNKCSLSCCSPQYPTPFQGDVDPFVCDKDGNSKYLSSDYVCQNNTGGIGCLCVTQKQVDGSQNGFVNYYVDKQNLGY